MISHHGYFRTAGTPRSSARYVRDEREAGGRGSPRGWAGCRSRRVMGADEALAAAEAEGLVLERTDARADGSGFIGVRKPTRAWERNGCAGSSACTATATRGRSRRRSVQRQDDAPRVVRDRRAGGAPPRARAPRREAALAAERRRRRRKRARTRRRRRGCSGGGGAGQARPRPRVRALGKGQIGVQNVYIIDTSVLEQDAPYHVAFNGKTSAYGPRARRPRRRAHVAAGGSPGGGRPTRSPTAPRRRPQHDAAQAAEGPRGAASAQACVGVGGGLGEAEARAEQGAVDVNMERLLGGGGGETSAAAAAEAEPEGSRASRHDASGGRSASTSGSARQHPLNERQLTAMLAAAAAAEEAEAEEDERARRRWWRMPTRGLNESLVASRGQVEAVATPAAARGGASRRATLTRSPRRAGGVARVGATRARSACGRCRRRAAQFRRSHLPAPRTASRRHLDALAALVARSHALPVRSTARPPTREARAAQRRVLPRASPAPADRRDAAERGFAQRRDACDGLWGHVGAEMRTREIAAAGSSSLARAMAQR